MINIKTLVFFTTTLHLYLPKLWYGFVLSAFMWQIKTMLFFKKIKKHHIRKHSIARPGYMKIAQNVWMFVPLPHLQRIPQVKCLFTFAKQCWLCLLIQKSIGFILLHGSWSLFGSCDCRFFCWCRAIFSCSFFCCSLCLFWKRFWRNSVGGLFL